MVTRAFTDNLLDILNIDPVGAFELTDIKDFPVQEFQDKQTAYMDYERWYSGENLEDTVSGVGGKRVEKYPVRINPVHGAVHKHAQALFGQISEDDRPLVIPKTSPVFKSEGIESKESKNKYERIDQLLHYIWYQNNGRALQYEAGLSSQIYGGCIFMARWTPTVTWNPIRLEIQSVPAKFFHGIPDPSNPFLLRKMWIVKYISIEEASYWGVTIKEDVKAVWVEEWDNAQWSIKINGQTAFHLGSKELSGENEWGFVPAVYIPHTRFGSLWGESLIKGLEGLMREINARAADVGDAVSQDSHSITVMRNVQGNYPVMKDVSTGLHVLNLGSNPALTGNEAKPDMFAVSSKTASESMVKFVDQLMSWFLRQAFVPAVAYGEDEGSQRSALTLAVRFWPLVQHVLMERVFWTAGMNIFNMMLLKIMHVNKEFLPEGFEVEESDLVLKMRQEWAPILPKDREAEVQEAVNRMANDLGSPMTLMEQLGDVDDPEQEVEFILKFKKALSDIEKDKEVAVEEARGEAMAKQSAASAAARPSATNNGSSKKKTGDSKSKK